MIQSYRLEGKPISFFMEGDDPNSMMARINSLSSYPLPTFNPSDLLREKVLSNVAKAEFSGGTFSVFYGMTTLVDTSKILVDVITDRKVITMCVQTHLTETGLLLFYLPFDKRMFGGHDVYARFCNAEEITYTLCLQRSRKLRLLK
ncbi:hypothetical protein [Bacillus suaedae]|uniref:Uncharacterized protein n=1 Tax=Halalkalibacter suaedae TaxID=2822140 RepID=A0A940WT47_9BACI|nr:hypothetical protein [Bacillus suaedae]MBP3950162.1 hypothetical protein [Bacillus suaedae]